jgi:hypothetical protein
MLATTTSACGARSGVIYNALSNQTHSHIKDHRKIGHGILGCEAETFGNGNFEPVGSAIAGVNRRSNQVPVGQDSGDAEYRTTQLDLSSATASQEWISALTSKDRLSCLYCIMRETFVQY